MPKKSQRSRIRVKKAYKPQDKLEVGELLGSRERQREQTGYQKEEKEKKYD